MGLHNSGKIVRHRKTGKLGRTYNKEELINGKIAVYFEIKDFLFEDKAVLCSADNLVVIGFID